MKDRQTQSLRPPKYRQPFVTLRPQNSADTAQLMVSDAVVLATVEHLSSMKDSVTATEIYQQTGMAIEAIKRSLLRLALGQRIVIARAQFRARNGTKLASLDDIQLKTGVSIDDVRRALFRLALDNKVVVEDAHYRSK